MSRDHELELIHPSQFEQLLKDATQSPRRRAVHCFHSGPDDNPHRFLNLILHGSYVAPHRHALPPKAESFVVLRGKLGVILFDDFGSVRSTHHLHALGEPQASADSSPACGLDLVPGIWHSIVALSPVAIIFEVKPGPYDAGTDKEFAPWAPSEADPNAPAYVEWLEQLFEGH
ncbi:MAG: WbuC family cupin fold metalloprotein [Bryobacterales bacterium]|nr:WbuC family cupin fold metalloprotein [Bryobacterales bacterium]